MRGAEEGAPPDPTEKQLLTHHQIARKRKRSARLAGEARKPLERTTLYPPPMTAARTHGRPYRRGATGGVPFSSSAAGAEEVDDGADGWEGIALGRGKADVECGFELVAELDQVECIPSEIPDKGGVEAHL